MWGSTIRHWQRERQCRVRVDIFPELSVSNTVVAVVRSRAIVMRERSRTRLDLANRTSEGKETGKQRHRVCTHRRRLLPPVFAAPQVSRDSEIAHHIYDWHTTRCAERPLAAVSVSEVAGPSILNSCLDPSASEHQALVPWLPRQALALPVDVELVLLTRTDSPQTCMMEMVEDVSGGTLDSSAGDATRDCKLRSLPAFQASSDKGRFPPVRARNYKPSESDLEDDDGDDLDDEDPSTWFDDDQDDGRKDQDIIEPDVEDLSDIIRVDTSRMSLPGPSGAPVLYVLEDVWAKGNVETLILEAPTLTSDACFSELLLSPVIPPGFSAKGKRFFRFSVPDEWYRCSQPRSTSSMSLEWSESTFKGVPDMDASEEEDVGGTAKQGPARQSFSARALTRARRHMRDLSSICESASTLINATSFVFWSHSKQSDERGW
ncbi:hypothetical protein EDB85DRAFT_2270242 [Lactarius pseudohatsudake]|nr:hypothetical protein EDB85DRAFT_2270242 [Lactarius pseudohatsudake]